MALFRNSLTYVWFFLVATTLLSWWLGNNGSSIITEAQALTLDFTLTVAIVLIALIKTRFVIWHFMEVRHCPAWLRWTCDSWLIVLAIILLGIYRYSLE